MQCPLGPLIPLGLLHNHPAPFYFPRPQEVTVEWFDQERPIFPFNPMRLSTRIINVDSFYCLLLFGIPDFFGDAVDQRFYGVVEDLVPHAGGFGLDQDEFGGVVGQDEAGGICGGRWVVEELARVVGFVGVLLDPEVGALKQLGVRGGVLALWLLEPNNLLGVIPHNVLDLDAIGSQFYLLPSLLFLRLFLLCFWLLLI